MIGMYMQETNEKLDVNAICRLNDVRNWFACTWHQILHNSNIRIFIDCRKSKSEKRRWRRWRTLIRFGIAQSSDASRKINKPIHCIESSSSQSDGKAIACVTEKIWVTGRLSTILIHISCTFNSQRRYIYIWLASCRFADTHRIVDDIRKQMAYGWAHTLYFQFSLFTTLFIFRFSYSPMKTNSLAHTIFRLPIYRFDVNRNGRIQTPT